MNQAGKRNTEMKTNWKREKDEKIMKSNQRNEKQIRKRKRKKEYGKR